MHSVLTIFAHLRNSRQQSLSSSFLVPSLFCLPFLLLMPLPYTRGPSQASWRSCQCSPSLYFAMPSGSHLYNYFSFSFILLILFWFYSLRISHPSASISVERKNSASVPSLHLPFHTPPARASYCSLLPLTSTAANSIPHRYRPP